MFLCYFAILQLDMYEFEEIGPLLIRHKPFVNGMARDFGAAPLLFLGDNEAPL
jgi:hypothetical protein